MQISNYVSSTYLPSCQRKGNTKYSAECSLYEGTKPSKSFQMGVLNTNLPEDSTSAVSIAECKDEEVLGNIVMDAGIYNQYEDCKKLSDHFETVSTEMGEQAEDYQKFLEEKINEIFIKIQNGDTEATYQIGTQSFTEKEWDEFLEKFDSIEEAIKKLMREEQERRETEKVQKEQLVIEDASSLLTTESTFCSYPTNNPKEDILYVTWYTREGIFCRKAGQLEGYEWSISFDSKEQYDKVMEFIGQFPSDWNLRFVAHENFWTDFLNNEIDMDGFMEFVEGTNKGVPDYSITVGDSMYIDKEKIQWAKYMNPLGTKFYTAEEMYQMQVELIAANKTKLHKLTDWDAYEDNYKKVHPGYNGEKICCEYPGGPLYTVSEIAQIMWKNLLKEQNLTEEEYFAQQAKWRAKMGYPDCDMI